MVNQTHHYTDTPVNVRRSLSVNPSSLDNIVESLFYRMLSLGMENNINEFSDLIKFQSEDED